ncbi:MAG: patatin-like phospholipase family protein [Betaproteobacteria bacterium]|nr:patatin-like phospholipase family protein [Betaproteobacteria bacterium]
MPATLNTLRHPTRPCTWLRAPVVLLAAWLAACASPPVSAPTAPPPSPSAAPGVAPASRQKPVIALALGGGGAKGFAHIGVIKALEAQAITVDIVVGTSAGSVVGALFAAGRTGFELQELAIPFSETQVSDWVLPDRGVVKGDSLARFINAAVVNQPLEKLPKKFGAVATDLASGEPILFRSGDTGTAVRASSSVPGIFQPVAIRGREYVDGSLASPVPVKFAREMGATFVIAVDISDRPANSKIKTTYEVLLQTLTIMGQTISRYELAQADLVIRPDVSQLGTVDFKSRHLAVLEGEKAATREMAALKQKLASFGSQ